MHETPNFWLTENQSISNKNDILFTYKDVLLSYLFTFSFTVPNIHWIVIEDAKVTSKAVQNLLSNCGVVFTLLNENTPVDQKLDVNKDQEKWWSKPRGVHQRNAALHWLRDAFR